MNSHIYQLCMQRIPVVVLPSFAKNGRWGSRSYKFTESCFKTSRFTQINGNYTTIVWTWNITYLDFWTSLSLTDDSVTLKKLEWTGAAKICTSSFRVCKFRGLVQVKLKRKMPLICSAVGEIVIKIWCCYFFILWADSLYFFLTPFILARGLLDLNQWLPLVENKEFPILTGTVEICHLHCAPPAWQAGLMTQAIPSITHLFVFPQKEKSLLLEAKNDRCHWDHRTFFFLFIAD